MLTKNYKDYQVMSDALGVNKSTIIYGPKRVSPYDPELSQ
jgi:hypothetical protein